MVKFGKKINYIYLLSIVVFSLFYYFCKPKPKLRNIIINDNISVLDSGISVNGLIDKQLNDNRVNVGDNYYFKDKSHWYYISKLSFWRNKYLNLNLIDKLSDNKDLKIKVLGNNNYAQVTYKNQKVVYACIKNTGNFYYNFNHNSNKIIDTTDFPYWREVFTKQINIVFNKFKPRNSECLLVITSNINLFDEGENLIKEIILSRFIF